MNAQLQSQLQQQFQQLQMQMQQLPNNQLPPNVYGSSSFQNANAIFAMNSTYNPHFNDNTSASIMMNTNLNDQQPPTAMNESDEMKPAAQQQQSVEMFVDRTIPIVFGKDVNQNTSYEASSTTFGYNIANQSIAASVTTSIHHHHEVITPSTERNITDGSSNNSNGNSNMFIFPAILPTKDPLMVEFAEIYSGRQRPSELED